MFDAIRLSSRKVEQTEEELRVLVRQLREPQRKAFYQTLARELKDPDTYAVLNFFFVAGLHHIYLKKYVRGCFNLFIMTCGVWLWLNDSGWAPMAGVSLIGLIILIELPALFRAQILVKNHNNILAQRVLSDLEKLGSH